MVISSEFGDYQRHQIPPPLSRGLGLGIQVPLEGAPRSWIRGLDLEDPDFRSLRNHVVHLWFLILEPAVGHLMSDNGVQTTSGVTPGPLCGRVRIESLNRLVLPEDPTFPCARVLLSFVHHSSYLSNSFHW